MAFTRRRIELTFRIGTGNAGMIGPPTVVEIPDQPNVQEFKGTDKNTVTLAGMRAKVHIQIVGGSNQGEAEVQVFGLGPDLLAQLTTVAQYAYMQRQNSLLISAGDDIDGMGVVYAGQIIECWADYSGQPDSVLHATCHAGGFYMAKPASPISYPGTANISTIIESIALQMGWRAETNNIVVLLATPYYDGTLIYQAQRAAEQANVDLYVDQANRTLVISEKGEGRKNELVIEISPETGMVGYPVHSSNGLIVTTLFDRNIKIKAIVNVKSPTVLGANGAWLVNDILHDLESETPNGEWYTHVSMTTLGNPTGASSFR